MADKDRGSMSAIEEEFSVSRSSDPFEVAKRLIDNYQKGVSTKVKFVDANVENQIMKEMEASNEHVKQKNKFVDLSNIILYLILAFVVIVCIGAIIHTTWKIVTWPFEGANFIECMDISGRLIIQYLFRPVAPTLLWGVLGTIAYFILFGLLSWLITTLHFLRIRLMHKNMVEQNKKDHPNSDLQTPP